MSECKSCQSEIHPGDNFCQDCGTSLETEEIKEEAQEKRPPAVLTCLNCGCQSDEPTSHCPACLSLMSDVGVYTTTVKALPQVDLKTVEPVSAETLAPSVPAKELHLTSPLLKRNGSFEKTQKRTVYKSPALGHAIVDLSPGVLLLAFFALVVVWFIDFDREKSRSSFQAAFAQAQTAAAANQLDQAIQVMDKLSVARSGSLSGDERALLNDLLFKRSQIYAGSANNKAAMFDLLRITPDFTQYTEARTKLSEYAALAQATTSAAVESAVAPEKADEKTAAAGQTVAEEDKKIASRAVATTEAPVSQPLTEAKAQNQSGNGLVINMAGQATEATVTAAPITNANHPAEVASSEQSMSAADSTVELNWKYTDADVARYNKLLADYFSSPRSAHHGPTRRPDGGVIEGPPTLREWLEQGKPNF